jgi:hypothetical protein
MKTVKGAEVSEVVKSYDETRLENLTQGMKKLARQLGLSDSYSIVQYDSQTLIDFILDDVSANTVYERNYKAVQGLLGLPALGSIFEWGKTFYKITGYNPLNDYKVIAEEVRTGRQLNFPISTFIQ